MAAFVFKSNTTALITGGASGIGLAMAKKCRGYGMNVVVVDNNAASLKSAEAELKEGGSGKGEVMMREMDVSKIESWGVLRGEVEGRFGSLSLLHLNAGIGLKSGWEDTSYFHKIMDVNLFGVIHGISTFLPSIKAYAEREKETGSAIVITGSKQGITNPPGNPAYNASKSAVKTLAEHLCYDLKDTSVAVHLLVPGWTFTGLTGGGKTKEKPAGAWTGAQVVDYLVEKMDQNKFYVICPDNDVTEEMDKKRMLWTMGDAVQGRPPLTRWRPEFKTEAEEWMAKQKV